MKKHILTLELSLAQVRNRLEILKQSKKGKKAIGIVEERIQSLENQLDTARALDKIIDNYKATYKNRIVELV